MDVDPQPLPDEKVFDSPEALNDYLALVRAFREQRKQARMNAERLEVAIGKVRDELDAARCDGDLDIVAQLEGVLVEFQRRHQVAVALASQPVVGTAPVPSVSSTSIEVRPTEDTASATRESDVEYLASAALEVIDDADRTDDLIFDVTEPSAEGLTLLCEGWLKQIEDLCDQWRELDAGGLRQHDKILNRCACLRLRSLACSLARVRTQANEIGRPLEVEQAVTELRDKMELARAYAGDTMSILPFDESQQLAAEDWDELARLYAGTADAQEVWDWYTRAQEEVGSGNTVEPPKRHWGTTTDAVSRPRRLPGKRPTSARSVWKTARGGEQGGFPDLTQCRNLVGNSGYHGQQPVNAV